MLLFYYKNVEGLILLPKTYLYLGWSVVKMKKTNKSYRKKYKHYFMVTLIIPTVIIFLMNLVTISVIKEQIVIAGEKTLTQFFNLMDEKIGKITEAMYEIVDDDEVQQYARLNAKDSRRYAFMRVGLLQKLSESELHKVLLWFEYDNCFLSVSEGYLEAEEIYRFYYSGEDMGVLREIQNAVNDSTILPTFHLLQSCETEEDCLLISLKQHDTSNKDMNFVVIVLLDYNYLNNVVLKGLVEENENMMLFDENGERLFASNEQVLNILPEEYRSQGRYRIEKNGISYVMFVCKSKVMKGFYAVMIPEKNFYVSYSKIVSLSGMGILGAMLFGFFIVSRMQKSAYRPIEYVLKEIGEILNYKYDKCFYNEVEYIVEGLNVAQRERETLYMQWEDEKENDLRKSFMLSVLENDAPENLSEEDFIDKGICSEIKKIMVGSFNVENWNTEVGQKVLTIISTVFEEMGKTIAEYYVIHVYKALYVVVLNSWENQEVLEELFLSVKLYIQQKFNIKAAVGMSNICNNLQELHISYQESQRALGYRFLVGNEGVISYRSICDRAFTYPNFSRNKMFHMIDSYLKTCDISRQGIKKLVDEIFILYGIGIKNSMELIEFFKFDVLYTLQKIFILDQSNYFKHHIYVENLSKAGNLDEYRRMLEDTLLDLGGGYQKNKKHSILGSQIKKYVDEHYMDQMLGVATIGEAFGMQPVYLSKIFKEQYNIVLLDYISVVRIEKSKQYLQNDKETINEIAEKVGFLSGNVFIKSFKKIEGVTPGKFRESEREIYKIKVGGE